jgi:hypothetical protein
VEALRVVSDELENLCDPLLLSFRPLKHQRRDHALGLAHLRKSVDLLKEDVCWIGINVFSEVQRVGLSISRLL